MKSKHMETNIELNSSEIQLTTFVRYAIDTVSTNSQHVTKLTGTSNGTHSESGVEASFEQLQYNNLDLQWTN